MTPLVTIRSIREIVPFNSVLAFPKSSLSISARIAPQGPAELGAQLAVALAVDDVLAVRLQRGCMTSHSIL